MNRPPLDYATPPPPRDKWWHFFVYHPDWLTHWGLAAVILGTMLLGWLLLWIFLTIP